VCLGLRVLGAYDEADYYLSVGIFLGFIRLVTNFMMCLLALSRDDDFLCGRILVFFALLEVCVKGAQPRVCGGIKFRGSIEK